MDERVRQPFNVKGILRVDCFHIVQEDVLEDWSSCYVCDWQVGSIIQSDLNSYGYVLQHDVLVNDVLHSSSSPSLALNANSQICAFHSDVLKAHVFHPCTHFTSNSNPMSVVHSNVSKQNIFRRCTIGIAQPGTHTHTG